MGFMLATLLETFSTRWSVQLRLKTSECSHADLRPQVNGMRSEKEILGSMECHALLTVSGSHRGRPKLERGRLAAGVHGTKGTFFFEKN